MNQLHPPTRATSLVILGVLVSTFLAITLGAADENYSPKRAGETEVLALVLKSEVEVGRWTKKDQICFSVDGLNPSPHFVKTLRKQDLNVRSTAEWRKKFNCSYEVLLRFVNFDVSKSAQVHAEVHDLREINEGVGHFAIRQKEGEYSVHKIDGKWSITEYLPSK